MKNIVAKSLLFLPLFLLFTGLLRSQQRYYPEKTWERRSPSAVKMKPTLVDSAVRVALRSENKVDRDLRIAAYKSYEREPGYAILGPMKPRGGPAGLVIKNGYIIASWGDVERVDMTFSVTKSYLSSIAGLAVDQGKINSVTDKVNRYLWDGHFESPHNAKITWEHLLNQSSDWQGELFSQFDWADRPPKDGSIDDWRARKLHEPGTHFKYNDIRVNLLAYALLQVWRKPLPVVLKEQIQDPIGASDTWRWFGYENSWVTVDGLKMQSVSGGGHFGGGLFINAVDQARYGLLFARKGKWKDRQLLSEQWINAAVKPSSANPAYGFLWWNNSDNALKGAPKELIYAVGYGGNYIVVDEKRDLVIVARWASSDAIGEIVQLVTAACD